MKTCKRWVAVWFTALSFMAEARDVDTLQARNVAEAFLSARGLRTELHNATPAAWEGRLLLYAAEGRGFVLLAADDAVRPVLAWSAVSPFPTDDLPTQVQTILRQYSAAVEYARRHGLPQHPEWKRLTSGMDMPSKTTVGPLMSTAWGQSYPYNTLCPYDPCWTPSPRSVTGCVATAMAQIMRYWQWPDRGWGQHTYECYTNRMEPVGTVSEQFDTVHYQWPLMPDVLDTSSSDAQVYAVSRLMYDCGVAVDMSYSFTESGALVGSEWNPTSPSAQHALGLYFRYHPQMRFVNRGNYTDAEWQAMMQAEFDASRPVLYSAGLHAFVADGYDSDGRLHFNLGWNGEYNGFYAVDSLCAATGLYALIVHAALIGIRPGAAESDSATVNAVVADTLTGHCTGGGRFAYASGVYLTAHAAEGYRFDGWTSGSCDNPQFLRATVDLTDTARLCPLAPDTLFYCTPQVKNSWSAVDVDRWGIRLPASCLHGRRELHAVQCNKGNSVDATVRVSVYNGSHPDDGSPLYEHTYVLPANSAGWVTLPLATPVVLDTSSDLWIVFDVPGGQFDWTLFRRSTYGGTPDGSWFCNTTGWHTLDIAGVGATWMIRALTRPASDSTGIALPQPDSPRITVYPNPFGQSVKIHVEGGRLRETAVLTDLAGRSEEVRLTAMGSDRYTLDLDAYPQGTYLLTLTTAAGCRHTVRLLGRR